MEPFPLVSWSWRSCSIAGPDSQPHPMDQLRRKSFKILSFYVYHLCCVWQFILSQLWDKINCHTLSYWLLFVLSTGQAGKCVGVAFGCSTATSKSMAITQKEWFVWWTSPFSIHKWFMNIVQNSLMWPLENVICKFLLESNSWSAGDHSNYHSC